MKRGRTRSISSKSKSGAGKHLRSSAKTHRTGSSSGFCVEELLESLRKSQLRELIEFWGGEGDEQGANGTSEQELRDLARGWMENPVLVEERVADLGRRLGAVLESLIASPGYVQSREELAELEGVFSTELGLASGEQFSGFVHGTFPRSDEREATAEGPGCNIRGLIT